MTDKQQPPTAPERIDDLLRVSSRVMRWLYATMNPKAPIDKSLLCVSQFEIYSELEKAVNRAAHVPRVLPVDEGRVGEIRKLTRPELNHLMALLEAERESGEYAGPREQYYARTERLVKWCQGQING